MSNQEPGRASRGQPATPQKQRDDFQQQDKGQPSTPEEREEVSRYMADLGAGTGVDIGPGAAGEMGGAAQDADPQRNEDELIYPDSGDFPHILPGQHDAP